MGQLAYRTDFQSYREIDAMDQVEALLKASPSLAHAYLEEGRDVIISNIFDFHGADIDACDEEIAEMVKAARGVEA